jgi:hypothetical protein
VYFVTRKLSVSLCVFRAAPLPGSDTQVHDVHVHAGLHKEAEYRSLVPTAVQVLRLYRFMGDFDRDILDKTFGFVGAGHGGRAERTGQQDDRVRNGEFS